jgi:hypothetical protein
VVHEASPTFAGTSGPATLAAPAHAPSEGVECGRHGAAYPVRQDRRRRQQRLFNAILKLPYWDLVPAEGSREGLYSTPISPRFHPGF